MKKILKSVFLILAVFFIIFTTYAAVKGWNVRTAQISKLNDGWSCNAGGVVVLPGKIKVPARHPVSIWRELPGDFDSETLVCFRSFQQEVTVRLDENIIYSYKSPAGQLLSHAPPGRWNFIKIPADSAGAVLKIEVVSPYAVFSGRLGEVCYGDAEVLYMAVYEQSMPVLGVLMLVLGVFLCAAYFVVKKLIHLPSILWLGLFLILFGIWSLLEARQLGLEKYVTTFTCWAYMLIPIPFLFYLQREWKGGAQTGAGVLVVLSFVNIVVCNLLQIAGVYDLMELMFLTDVLVVVVVVYGCVWEIRRFCAVEAPYRKFRLGIAVFFYVSVIIEVLLRYVLDFYNTRVVLRVGVVIFACGLSIDAVMEIADRLSKDMQIQEQLQKNRMKLMIRQMQPHFLFNSLYAIQALCYTAPMEAADAVVLFSNYLRANMNCLDNDGLIFSDKELEHIENYIKIQQMCFGSELIFKKYWTAERFQIPPLTIQPFVENAVRHGIRRRKGTGTVVLRSYNDDADTVVTIEDDGVGYDVDAPLPESSFHSTENVRFRLERMVGATVKVESVPGRGTRVTIRIPAKDKEQDVV